ncbi:MAG: alpha/beta hydrolase, partial [Desulfobacterales bacterium]
RLVIMNTAAFLPPEDKKLPLRLWIVRNIRWLAAPAVLGLNIFSIGALYMASHKGLSRAVKSGMKAPYNSWRNRIATLKFVQDIPLSDKDPSYALVRSVDSNLNRLADIPMLICWGKHDFVFDDTYLAQWQQRFPDADVHLFDDAGHFILEDKPEAVASLVKDFLKKHQG